MTAPILFDLKFFRDAFHEIQLSDSWRISTSKCDDVIWNIVLAYLNSFPVSDENELSRRIQLITGHEEVNENIKYSIRLCNPFLHRNACFTNKDICNLVAKFKETVEDYIRKSERPLQTSAKSFGYLEVSSKLLSCNIILISLEKKTATVFPTWTPPNLRKIYRKHISIIDESNSTGSDGNIQDQVSFCIPKEIGIERKRQALTEILKRSRKINYTEQKIHEVSNFPDITEHFLTTLLKNHSGEVISLIYKSAFVLLELADAGFETDPRTEDSSGKSAFFYALRTEDWHIVSLMYDHAANACLQTEASVRSPDPAIVENLLNFKDYLKRLRKDLESEEVSQKSRYLFTYISRFNEFQIEICKSINDIKHRINYSDETGKRFQASQRKEVILTILRSYETNFDYISGELEQSVDASCSSRFKEFLTHKHYFDKLDINTAMMFFDNLFLLKERLKLPKKAYLDVESIFFRFLFFRKYLKQYKKQKKNYIISQLMSFQERLSLGKQLRSFKEILEKAELSEDNIVDKIPNEVVRTLTNLPEIYGQFLIYRIKVYLKAATELTVKDVKSVLVIERCLQVLGESCTINNFDSIQSILILALSKDFSKHLNDIRDSLSHIESQELLNRNELEENVELFKEIQNELVQLSQFLLPIYSLHEYQLNEFLITHSEMSLKKCKEMSNLQVHENPLKVISPSLEMEESELPTAAFNDQNLWGIRFQQMYTSLNEKQKDLRLNGKILTKNNISCYRYIIQNMISAIEDELKSFKFAVPLKVVESQFWCLETILNYCTTDKKLFIFRRRLRQILIDRKSHFSKLKTETTGIDESEKVSDLRENNEDPETIIQNEGNYSSFAISSTLCDDRLQANAHHDSLVKDEAESFTKEENYTIKYFIEYATASLHDYKTIARTIFQAFPDDSNEENHFKNLEIYCLKLEGKNILKESEKEFVLGSVPERFRNVDEVKRRIIGLLKEENVEFTDELNNLLSILKLKAREVRDIKKEIEKFKVVDDSVHVVVLAGDYFDDLKKAIRSEKLDKSEYELLCEKLKLPDVAKVVLLKLVPRQKGNRLDFLRNRIKTLKKILIDDHDAIKQLWERETISGRIMHVKEKIVQLYLKDSVIQASVEALLFHCMSISRNKKLKELWKKTTNLFSGINLRNVLAHGHPLLESLGSILDPYDLPSQLVEKMLQLISDEHVIDCMQQILEQSGADLDGFNKIMEDEESEQFKNLREQISNCDRWQSYAVLISPRKKCKT